MSIWHNLELGKRNLNWENSSLQIGLWATKTTVHDPSRLVYGSGDMARQLETCCSCRPGLFPALNMVVTSIHNSNAGAPLSLWLLSFFWHYSSNLKFPPCYFHKKYTSMYVWGLEFGSVIHICLAFKALSSVLSTGQGHMDPDIILKVYFLS